MTEDFKRYDNLFSLCGLNCGLCPMQIRSECPGCFKESFCAKQCPIVPCSIRHGNIQYCFECDEYPCAKYDDIDRYDSLISHKNQKSDMAKAKRIGIENYLAGQKEKHLILHRLLTEYDDRHREVFFCLAVNLMETDDLYAALESADRETVNMTVTEKSDQIKQQLDAAAQQKGITLRLQRSNKR